MKDRCHPLLRRRRARGLGLLEMLVALALGLLVVGMVAMHPVATGRSARLHAALAQMTDDAQIALQLLSSELLMAGYAAPQRLVTGADGAPRWQTGLADAPVFACDTGFVAPSTKGAPACAASGTSAALAVRYQADAYNTVPLAQKTEPSDCLGHGLGDGAGPFFTDNRWFVASSQDGRTELRCASRLGLAGQPLVENVESLALWFSQAQAAEPAQPVRYVTAAQVDDFSRVRSVRICLLMRSTEPVLSAEETPRYLDCQGQERRQTDGRLRRAFHGTVALRVAAGG